MKGSWWLKPKTVISRRYSAAPNLNSSEFEANNWELSELVVNNLVPIVGTHPFPLNELLLMSGTLSRFKPKMIFEWGTHIGKSARIFHEVSQALNLKSKIHSIDLPDDQDHVEHPHTERGRMVKDIPSVKLHQGDGLDIAMSILRRQKPPNNKGGGVLFFLDGDHEYESVKRELSAIMKSAPKAVILVHDTFYQDSRSKYNVGPFRAVGDCLKHDGHKYKRIDTGTGLPGMTLLFPL